VQTRTKAISIGNRRLQPRRSDSTALEGGPQGYDVRVYGGATLAFQLRGHAYIKRGNLDLAIVDYTQVIRLHSKGESSLLFPLDKQLQGDI
jgi:hypothetical protein